MADTTLDERLLIEIGITDKKLIAQLARANQQATQKLRQMEAAANRTADRGIKNLGDSFDRMGMDAQRSTRMATAGVVGLGAAMQRSRFQIQNASYQIGDFAVQVAGGTSASRALAQQLPQLLGGFGVLGAVLGAAASISIPLFTSALGSAGDEALTAEDRAKALADAVNAFVSASEAASMSVQDLAGKYGSLATEAQAALAVIANVEQVRAMQAVRTEAEALSNTLMTYFDSIESSTGGYDLIVDMEGLAEATGLAAVQAQTLAVMLLTLANSDLSELADRAGQLQDYMLRTYGSVEAMPAEMQALYQSLAEAVVKAAEMQGAMEATAEAATNTAAATVQAAIETARMGMAIEAAKAGMGGLAQNAWGVVGALVEAVNQAAALAAFGNVQVGPMGAARGGTVNSGGGDGIPTPPGRPQARPADIDFGYVPATGGGSPGGGGSAIEQAPEWWDDLIEKVREGEQAWEDYNQTVERGANAMADFFTSIVDGSKSAKEALADLLMQLAQVQFQKAFLGLAGAGGTTGNIFSALGSALTVPSFDGGGYTGSGARTGGMDGKGGFPALLHPNETVIDHTKGGGAGGGQVSVVVRMEGGNLVPVIESVSGSVTARAMAGYDRQLPSRIRQISSDRRAL